MNIKAFMKEELKDRGEMTFPGVETFKDEKGQPIPFIIRKLSKKEINDIRDFYTTETVFRDKQNRNRPLVENGHVVTKEDYNAEKAGAEMMVVAFVQPKLDDPELMKFYGVDNRLDMPGVVFAEGRDLAYANECLMIALGMKEQETEDELVDEVKNS